MLRPAFIRAEWAFVKEGLDEVKRLRGGTWRPEDVYADCIHKAAYLWVCDDGFVIFKPIVDEYSGENILLVWLAWGKSNVDLIDRYQNQIIEIAKSQDFTTIRFYRNAKGNVEHKGWRKTFTIYDMEI